MNVSAYINEVDVVILGAGPGGYVAAIRAAQLGKLVVLIDRAEVGGVCLNRGCIPSKALISAAHQYEAMLQAGNIGIRAERVQLDFSKVQHWKNSIVSKLTGGVSALLSKHKINLVQGEAHFLNRHNVSVSTKDGTRTFKFRNCIIATGSSPVQLTAFPYGNRILSSTEALNLVQIPESIVVVGGGYIGIELGQMYAKYGVKVSILEGSNTILPGFSKELSQLVLRKLKKSGVEVYTQALAQEAIQNESNVTVICTVNGEPKEITSDYVMVTVGRQPNTKGLQLEAAGVRLTDHGLIDIDKQCRTNVTNIYAIGDVVAGPALAHKASYEGKIAAEAIAGRSSRIDYRVIPSVVFCDPEIAKVGLNESEAKEEGYDVIVGRFHYAANGRALSLHSGEGFVEIVAQRESGHVLGAQIIGTDSSNLIAEIGLAIEMGASLEDIALTIHAHPTLSEMVMEACESAMGQSIHLV